MMSTFEYLRAYTDEAEGGGWELNVPGKDNLAFVTMVDALNHLGGEGWEMVSAGHRWIIPDEKTEDNDRYSWEFFFKRQKIEG
ncbi:MAG: hypothetical protein ACLGSA_12490 [Acidobacteriota bacterium]